MKLCIFAFFALFAATMLAAPASAGVVSEKSLADLGYADFEVSGARTLGCTTYEFANPLEPGTEGFHAQYTILSLHVEFLPVASSAAGVMVYLNAPAGLDMPANSGDENAVAELSADDFIGGWARVALPNTELVENNALEVCAGASNTTTTVRVLSTSLIGRYHMPDFSGEHGFEMIISGYAPKLNAQFTVAAVLRNYGSEAADFELRYRRQSLDMGLPEIEIIRGSLNAEGTIGACTVRDSNGACTMPAEERIEYTAKAIKPGPITLLPAILTYTNIFGEQIVQESNRPGIEVRLPEISIEAFIAVGHGTLEVGQYAPVRIVVKNAGHDELNNIDLRIAADAGLHLVGEMAGEGQVRIPSILPGTTIYFDVNATSGTAGEYEIGCVLNYIDYNIAQSGCAPVTLTYETAAISPLLVGGIVLLVLAIVVYAYISRG